MSMVINPFWAAGSVSTDFYRSAIFNGNTTTGSQTLTFPSTTWTPKAVIIRTVLAVTALDSEGGGSFCQGFATGPSAEGCHVVGYAGDVRRTRNNAIICSYDQTYVAEVTSFGAGTVTINWTANGGLANKILVEVYGGDAVLNAAVNTVETPAAGSASFSVGFRPQVVLTAGALDMDFTNQSGANTAMGAGYAAFDASGTLVGQAARASIAQATGSANSLAASNQAYTTALFTGTTSTTVTYTSTVLSTDFIFLALELDPVLSAWAGVVQCPVAGDLDGSGNYDLVPTSPPSFTPTVMNLLPSYHTVLNTGTTGAEANANGFAVISEDFDGMIRYRRTKTDSGSGGTSGNQGLITDAPIKMVDHRLLNPIDATLNGMIAGGADMNFTNAGASNFYWPCLMIGPT